MSQNKTGTFKHGLKVGENVHKEFELRQATAGDYFDAEADCDPNRPITFRSALAARQLVRVGSFEGPFTLAMIGRLTPGDLQRLMQAREELEREGESEQLG